jgi:adenylate kinase
MILLLLGAPGAGKGTVSNILTKGGKFKTISTGELLRAEVNSGSKLGKKLSEIMKSGQLVSSDIVNNLVKSKILQYVKQKTNVILDGYPRSVDQAKFLDTFTKIDLVANLKADKKSLVKRLTGR